MNLTKGKKYNVKVVALRYKKNFPSGQGPIHVHLLDIVDKQGEAETVEYKSLNDDVQDLFPRNAWQFILVKFDNPEVVVEPCDPPEEKPLAAPYMPQNNAQSQVPVVRSPLNLNVSGSSVTFAMAYAKDIAVAEIAAKGHAYTMTGEDIRRMISNADAINKAICERVKPQ